MAAMAASHGLLAAMHSLDIVDLQDIALALCATDADLDVWHSR
jgi:hypothetical protein